MRSQNFTYAMEIKKKATVTATKIMSRISVFSRQSEALARSITVFDCGAKFSSPRNHMECTLVSAAGLRRESSSKYYDSHRNVSCGINRTFAGSGLFARYIGRVPYSFKADRVLDTYFLSVDSQCDEKLDHETHAQDTQDQHGVDRWTRNCIRLKHCGLTPHWIM